MTLYSPVWETSYRLYIKDGRICDFHWGQLHHISMLVNPWLSLPHSTNRIVWKGIRVRKFSKTLCKRNAVFLKCFWCAEGVEEILKNKSASQTHTEYIHGVSLQASFLMATRGSLLLELSALSGLNAQIRTASPQTNLQLNDGYIYFL